MRPETSAVVLIAGGAMLLWWTVMMLMAMAGPVPGEALTLGIVSTVISLAAMFLGVGMEEHYA